MATVSPVQLVPAETIHRDPNNAFKHADGDIARLHGVVEEYGFLGALAVDEDLVLIGGEARLEVLTQLGYEEIPVNIVTGLSPDERTALAISLNASYGDWNEARMRTQILDLKRSNYDVDLTGLKPFEITRALDLSTKPEQNDQGSQQGDPILSYQVVFNSDQEQQDFLRFVSYLKERYPDRPTVAARMTAYVAEMIDD